MKLHHIAFWTKDIEKLEAFYVKHFAGKVLFEHKDGDFRCKFISIAGGIKLELMTRKELSDSPLKEPVGYSHFSMECESKEEVNRLTDYFIECDVPLEKIKEQYDDGFYESSVIDPDGNIIELAYVDRVKNPAV